MSGKTNAESEGVVSKVKVKRQIKTIVKDLENILGDLKDVAKELKEVVHDIDSLTSDLRLEEELTDSSKTDTLNSSSSSTTTTTTASSIEKVKHHLDDSALRLALERGPSSLAGHLANGTLFRNGLFPGKPVGVPSRDLCCIPKSVPERGPRRPPPARHEKSRCPQATRERVRFSEKVQYHGYCPDCDLQYNVNNTDAHLHSDLIDAKLSPAHYCSSPPGGGALLENGCLSASHSFPPANTPCVPHPLAPKPQKTILRKSTTTTV
ncbi:hypothetical protein ANANG_G00199400 [Anguilla anguilla]|uniref:Proline rich 16 n=1 Tax=Anguilla anguilla TaxID=7936 RepID=A0A9D3M2L7_ANGAN|nr:hypothetical protein ANANG_G00199400 [Anguilla anguilla]